MGTLLSKNYGFGVRKHEHVKRPLNLKKNDCMVCFQKERHFLPILFEDNDHRVTVDYKRYMNMLRKHFILVLRRRRVFDIDATMFQQGDAPPHCSKHTLEYLRQYFSGDRLNLKED